MRPSLSNLAGVAVVAAVLIGGIVAEAATRGPTPQQMATLGSCQGCHDLTPARKTLMGPPLYGAFGKKPSISGVPFAKWDRASLDRFLADPSAVKPTTAMPVNVPDAKERAAIVRALEALR